MPVKLDKRGWPVELIVPDVDEFVQGDWVQTGSYADDLATAGEDEDEAIHKAASDYHCGTRCCLVGWMGVAFHGPFTPGDSITPAQRKFAKELLRAGGRLDEFEASDWRDDEELLYACSDMFEGLIPSEAGKTARKLWIEAGEACSYDLAAFKRGQK